MTKSKVSKNVPLGNVTLSYIFDTFEIKKKHNDFIKSFIFYPIDSNIY